METNRNVIVMPLRCVSSGDCKTRYFSRNIVQRKNCAKMHGHSMVMNDELAGLFFCMMGVRL